MFQHFNTIRGRIWLNTLIWLWSVVMRLAKPGVTKPRVIRMRTLSSSGTSQYIMRKRYEKNKKTCTTVVNFVGYLNIMDLINARKMERIKMCNWISLHILMCVPCIILQCVNVTLCVPCIILQCVNVTLCVPCIILQCVNDQWDAQFL